MFPAEQERGQLTIPALPFTLFLFIQHLHKISLKASLVTGSDEFVLGNVLHKTQATL